AKLDRAHDHVEERGLAPLVTFGARQAPRFRPPAIAVHDQGDMAGPELGRDGGRRGAVPLGGRGPHPARPRWRGPPGTARPPRPAGRLPAIGRTAHAASLTRVRHAAASGWNAPDATAGTRRPGRCTLPGGAAAPRRPEPSPRAAARSSARPCARTA